MGAAGKTRGVAVIGCGGIGKTHLQAFREIDGVRLVAVSSRHAERAQAVAQEYGCQFTDDANELIGRAEVDLVSITTSSGSHARLALRALEAGKHVILEKPMAMNVADAHRVVDLARARDLTLSVISQRRFERIHRIAKRVVEEGALGKLLLLEASCPYYRTDEYYQSADWRGTIAEDGGALMNQAIHSVDLLLWFGGPVRTVYARTATQTHQIEAEDMATTILCYESGALGTIMASTSIRPGFLPTLNLYGDKGTIKFEGAAVVHWTVPGVDEPAGSTERASAGVQSPQLASHAHHKAQLEDVLEAIESGRPPAVTGLDGLRAVELVDGAYRSAASGLPVTLDGVMPRQR